MKCQRTKLLLNEDSYFKLARTIHEQEQPTVPATNLFNTVKTSATNIEQQV